MTIASLELFDIPRTLPKCQECGNEFEKKNSVQRFCGGKCKNRHNVRRIDEENKKKSEAGTLLGDLLPKREPKGERDKQICAYLDEGWPWLSVAKKLGVNRSYVRKRMIILGRWRPNPKHNGIKRKGTGAESRKPNAEEIERRRIQAKTNMAEAGKRRSVLLAIERRKRMGPKAALVLMDIRNGITLQASCRSRGFSYQAMQAFLSTRKSYRKLREKTNPNSQQASKRSNFRRTKEFKDEYEVQAKIAEILNGHGIKFTRESPIPMFDVTVDFEADQFLIEVKAETTATELKQLIGQAAAYSTIGKKVFACFPDDVGIPANWVSLLVKHNITLLTVGAVSSWITTGNAPEFIGKERVRGRTLIKCKCCGNENSFPSYSPSGSARSYCRECESVIAGMVYNQSQDKWICVSPSTAHPYKDSFRGVQATGRPVTERAENLA